MPHEPQGMPPDDEQELEPREAARLRRRDHDADAERRDLMRPGMGKVFKQIVDKIGDEATQARSRAQRTIRGDGRRR